MARSPLRKLRVYLGAHLVEARLLDTGTADAVYDALPLALEGAVVDGEITLAAPIHAPMESDARAGIRPGEIALRSLDQTIVIGCAHGSSAPAGSVCMAAQANVFALISTELPELNTLPARLSIRFERTPM